MSVFLWPSLLCTFDRSEFRYEGERNYSVACICDRAYSVWIDACVLVQRLLSFCVYLFWISLAVRFLILSQGLNEKDAHTSGYDRDGQGLFLRGLVHFLKSNSICVPRQNRVLHELKRIVHSHWEANLLSIPNIEFSSKAACALFCLLSPKIVRLLDVRMSMSHPCRSSIGEYLVCVG